MKAVAAMALRRGAADPSRYNEFVTFLPHVDRGASHARLSARARYFTVNSKKLSEFLEALSDDRLPSGAKLDALIDVWRNRRRPST